MSVAVNTSEDGKKAEEQEPRVLSRWLVSFACENGWYPVGEYIALDASSAIERAVEILGPGAAYQAELIPWDALPLSKAMLRARGN